MVFRYLDRGADLHGDAEVVTNNHFDQDGLVGVFALVDPATALAHRDVLTDVAAAGDFGTYRHRTSARIAMALVQLQADDRYVAALELLPQMVDDIERFRDLWAEEDDALTASEQALEASRIRIHEEPELDLAVVTVDEGAPDAGGHRFAHLRVTGPHPMAINNATGCFRVATLRGDRYDLTFRYETWVQYRSRRPLPRIDLAPLAAELQADDPGAGWAATGPGDLTPTLAMAAGRTSTLAPDDFLARVRRHLRDGAPAWDPYDPAG
jgi:hypothetical protein